MFEILETLGTTHVIITDGDQQIDDYVVHQNWHASPDDPQGIYKYYEQDNRLSEAVVEAIFDEFIDDLEIDSLHLTRKELQEASSEGKELLSSGIERED